MARVYVVVVSYRDRDAAAGCLTSVLASRRAPEGVVVIDNASGDGTAEALAGRFPRCRVVAARTNTGFGGGCNQGLDLATADRADLVLLLNQDTTVDPEMLGRLVEFMESHPRAAVVGPKTLSGIVHPDGRPRRLYAGAWRRRLPLIQDIPGIEEVDTADPDLPVRTDYVWGHGMMLRVAALAETGAFDPAFFMYCEDIDLCRRLQASGHEIWCEPRAVMWHDIADGARAERSERWRWTLKVRSIGIFHRKHYPAPVSGLLSFLTVIVEAKRLLWRGRLRAAGHLAAAFAAALVGLGDPRGVPTGAGLSATGVER